eukprot:4773227-Prymnesium_polylepis.1
MMPERALPSRDPHPSPGRMPRLGIFRNPPPRGRNGMERKPSLGVCPQLVAQTQRCRGGGGSISAHAPH